VSGTLIYIDSSALIAAVQEEHQHHRALLEWLQSEATVGQLLSSKLLDLEVNRRYVNSKHSTQPLGPDFLAAANALIDRLVLVGITDQVLAMAKQMNASVKSLDAIHVATALTHTCKTLVTYDVRMFKVADRFGMIAASPE